jgi:hypothetical protein
MMTTSGLVLGSATPAFAHATDPITCEIVGANHEYRYSFSAEAYTRPGVFV